MSMHAEFERAIAGSSRKGPSPLKWLFGSLALFLVVGVVGVGFAMNRVAHKVEGMLAGFDYDAGAAASKVVAQLESHTELLSADPDQGLSFLQALDGSDPASALMGEFFDNPFGMKAPFGDLAELADIDGSQAKSLHTRDGNVSIDIQKGSGGGSLVIRSDDGNVRLDLRRTENGGSLVIDSDEGQARIGLQKTETGGYLSVDSDEGSIRFELIRSDEGGQLLVNTDDGESLRLAFGDNADALPQWVPRLDGMPERPRPVYSLSADKGSLGAVAWTQDVPAQDALAFYQAQLEDAGYDIRVEHQRDGSSFDEASLWAKDEASGRVVYMVAHEGDHGTKLLVGFGEEVR